MSKALKPQSWILFWSVTAGSAVGGLAAAQEPPPATPSSSASQSAPATQEPGAKVLSPPKSSAQIDAGEPRANTSAPAPGGASGTSSAASGPAAGAPAATPAAGGPAAGKPAAGTQPAARAPKAAGQKPPGVDRLELNTATVTGEREQPKVMYIVPWKSSDIGDLSGKPMNSLLDEALAPVDRDEFKREVVYFDVMKADRSQNGSSGPAAKQGEK
jgi:hypothetical protein